jgi:death on curing protein
MLYLGLADVVYLHGQLIAQSGGSAGLRDQNGLESALAQPRMTFGGVDLYPDIAPKRPHYASLWY